MNAQKEVIFKIYTNRKSYEFYPNAYKKSRLTIGSLIENDVWVPELSAYRYILSNFGDSFLVEQIDEEEKIVEKLQGVSEDHPYLALGSGDIHLVMIVPDYRASGDYYSLIEINADSVLTSRVGEITIGSGDKSGFPSKVDRITKKLEKGHISIKSINLPLVSSVHALLYYSDFGEFWIEDVGATNGVYVNEFLLISEDGKRPRKKLTYGDIIDLFTARIVFYENYLFVESIVDEVKVFDLEKANPIRLSAGNQSPILELPPRNIVPLPTEPVKLPTPPSETKSNRDFFRIITYIMRPMIWLLLPLLAGVIDKNATGSIGVSWITSIMYTVGPLMMVAQFIRQGIKTKKENKRKVDRYRAKLDKKVKEIDENKKNQLEIISKTHTSPRDNLRRSASFDWRLWERTENDDDFLEIKIGTGVQKPSFDVVMPTEETLDNRPDDLVEELEKTFEDHKDITNYPITIDMKSSPCIGLVGVYESRTNAAVSMLLQASIHHSPNDLKIILIYPENQKEQYRALKYLPHLWLDGRRGRAIFVADNTRRTCDGKCKDNCVYCYRDHCFNALLSGIKNREKMFQDPDVENKHFLPRYLFVVADVNLIKGPNSHDLCGFLFNDNSHLGVYTICLGERRTDIPSPFRMVYNTGFDKGNYSDNEGRDIRFHMDLYQKNDAERISRSLAPLVVESLVLDKSVPSYVTLLDLFGAKTLDELKIAERWKTQYRKPIPMAPVGKFEEKKLFYLDITRKGIGPHGIVGGTTGSGKSEFLLSVIVGMAVSCHPHRLGMVILDYKGGSTAEACKALPHVHGIVTDLDNGVLTKRALAAIKFEVEHRENTFRDYSNRSGKRIEDIESYYELVPDGPVVPYLLVIVDELAELKIRENAAMEILEDIARRGRSVGIYLLLTTQNPQGVINAQIQANVNYKVSFRISKENSRGIIDSPDAAYISDRTPGRALMRVGNNELQVFQSAYTGAPYIPKTAEVEKEVPSVFEVNLEGQKRPIYSRPSDITENGRTSQLTAVVNEIIKTSRNIGMKSLDDFWLPVLPSRIFLSSIMENTRYEDGEWTGKKNVQDLSVIVGLSDNIRNRSYDPTIIDFAEEKSHLAIYGPAYSGKSTLIHTIITSMVLQNSPDEIHAVVLDLGTTPSSVLKQLPHVRFYGSSIQDVSEGIHLIAGEFDERATKFRQQGVSNIDEYNGTVPADDAIPTIFIFVDNIDVMSDYSSRIIEEFENVFKNGLSFGIFIVASSRDKRSMPYEFRKYFESHSCCLWPEDSAFYDLPRGFSMTDRTPGRGFYKGYEFQTALPVYPEPGETLNKAMLRLFSQMNGYRSPKQERVKDEMIDIGLILSTASEKSDSMIPVGYDVSRQEIQYFNMERYSQIMVSWLDIQEGRNKIAYLFNTIMEHSVITRGKNVVLWTRDESWSRQLHDYEKIEVHLFSDKNQSGLHEFMEQLYANQELAENTMLICDEWGELIRVSSMDTYNLMRRIFKEDDIINRIFIILGANSDNIKVWSQKGCPQVVRAINKQVVILADGTAPAHDWTAIKNLEDHTIDRDFCWWVDQDRRSFLRLALEVSDEE